MRGGFEFGVLGPLRISAAGAELAVTSPRSRTFLALLALNTGRQVTVYEFADAIWGASLPKSPRRAVQLCAVRVRALLEPVGAGDLVVTCPDGYRLALAAQSTDLGRVAIRLREADAAAERGDTAAELAAVTAALDEWRGEPLADVPSEVLQREVSPGLREQRLRLTERRFDILLRGQGGADLVDELLTLTARHPLRERLWRQLMAALHRSGRRGEALNAYHTFRRGLSDELGIDPSAEIRALHTSILTGRADTGLGAVPASPPIPRELPPDPAAFAGRGRDLAGLDALLLLADESPGPVVGVITGTAGVGKTSLAVHWARRVAERFPDGQLFVNLRGYHPDQALTPHRVLARFLRTLGVRGEDIPEDTDELAAMYRSVLDGRRMLIVLDNVNSSDQARPLLPSAAGCLVLITSRDVLLSLVAADNASQVRLDLPSRDEARRMLARRLGAERLDGEPAAADDIIAASARLPLALAIAAARAKIDPDTPLRVVAEQLRAGLDAFDTASALTDVRAVFSWSYQALSPDAARLLRLLGLHPGPDVTVPGAASLSGRSPRDAARLFTELARAHLVVEDVPGRYALHDLMREYCVELVCAEETGAERDLATRRAFEHYLHTAHAAAGILRPLRTEKALGEVLPEVRPEELADYDAAISWFTAEQDVLLSLLDWALSAGFDRQVWQLVRALAGHFERQGNVMQWTGCMMAALTAAERLDDPILQAEAHRGLGRLYAKLARTEDAHRHYTKALDLFRGGGDLTGEAHIETNLAALHEQQGRYPQALEHAVRALEMHKQLDDGGYAWALNTVAWCYARVDQHRLALDHGRRALAESRKRRAPYAEAAVLDTIGFVHHRLGRFAEAIDSYQQAIRLKRQVEDHYHTAVSLINLGDTYEALGDRDSAHGVWREAESILDELQLPAVERVRAKLRGAASGSE